MKIVVEGVTIELTAQQEAQIKLVREERKKHVESFEKVLRHFGFNKINTKDWADQTVKAFQQHEYNWYAEIQDPNKVNSGCWLVGNSLKSGGKYWPGHTYFDPEAMQKEIVRALDELQKTDK